MPTPPHPELPAPTQPLPAEGSISIRVRYAECDPQGVAHHASYAPWLEEARTELLRGRREIDPDTGVANHRGGMSYAEMERAGVFLVIAKLAISYKAPAHYDDWLRIDARVAGGGRARLDHEYELWRQSLAGERHALLATATTTLACVGKDGRPRPLPPWLTPATIAPDSDHRSPKTTSRT